MTVRPSVERLHLRCHAGRADERRALRLRGRLETTARLHLPDALERALGSGGRRVFAERVTVRLDFDPADYDDVTVAALWAGRVARALEEAGAASQVTVFESERELHAAAAAEWADTGGLTWHFEELGCGTGERVPAPELLAAFDTQERVAALAAEMTARPGRLERVRARLDAAQRELLLAALSGELRWGDWGATGRARGGAPRPGARAGAPADAGAGDAPAPGPPTAKQRPDPAAAPSARGAPGAGAEEWRVAWQRCASTAAAEIRFREPGRSPGGAAGSAEAGRAEARPLGGADEARRVAAGANRETPGRRTSRVKRTEGEAQQIPARMAWHTRVAGLVLLYPWLEGHLDGERPDDMEARMWALAALAGDEEENVVLDPLVRALAGDDPARDSGGRLQVPSPEADELHASAEAVLARFAGALPGFEGSTPAYLRREFLVRRGRLDALEAGGYAVLLEARPLDLALERLPYPLAPFALPWTPVFTPSIGRPGA